MALADYRLCDVCERKAFYDANLNYDFEKADDEQSTVRQCGEPVAYRLDYLGDWVVLCEECAKTHEVIVIPRSAAPSPDGLAKTTERSGS